MHGMFPAEFSILGAFGVGLTISVGHCVGMCSGIVLAYSGAKMGALSRSAQLFGHGFYALGRISSYAVIGFIIGLIAEKVMPSATTKAVLFAILGAFLVLIGVSMLGKSRFLALLESDAIVKSAWYKRAFMSLIGSKSMASFYGIGVLNGLLPCGMVYAAAAWSLAASSAAIGAASMAAFGLGTAPALFAIGTAAGFLTSWKYRSFFVKLSAAIVILMGAYTIYHAIGIYDKGGAHAAAQHKPQDMNATHSPMMKHEQ